MKRLVVAVAALGLLSLAGFVWAGDTPSLLTASGNVVKVEKDKLTIQPRGEGGKFGKNLVLRLTGTSKVTVLTEQKRGGKMVPVQNEISAKELQTNQHIAVIYNGAKNAVLLSAVAVPAPSK
jgi:hypothetical protein